MQRLAISDPIRTEEILHHYHLRAKKNFGQNFLVNPGIINEIVKAAQIAPGDNVIEIGPGIGSLTEQLLAAGANVLAYEIDDDLIPVLENELPQDNLRILHQDVLKSDLVSDANDFFGENQPVKVVANLPYYITTPIIFYFIESPLDITGLTVMMQKEVGERIIANPGVKDFGPLSIAVQTLMNPKIALQVSPKSFNPSPKVDSVVVTMTKKSQPIDLQHPELFNLVVKTSFQQRRKTIFNNLKSLVGKKIKNNDELHEILATTGIKENSRAEQLAISDFINLTDVIYKQ